MKKEKIDNSKIHNKGIITNSIKAKTDNKIMKKLTVRKKLYSSSSEEETVNDFCNDTSEEEIDEFDNEICIIRNEFGKSEIWFRCGVWAHKECTGHNDYKTYICDFCA